MREIAPEHEQHWFDLYGRVALSGETLRFERPAAALQRYYEVCAFRVGAPELRRVGIVFNDITGRKSLERQRELLLIQEERLRKDAEAAVRAKDHFLAALSHELRTPLSPCGLDRRGHGARSRPSGEVQREFGDDPAQHRVGDAPYR